MTKIYLAGPLSNDDNPYRWHHEVMSKRPDIDWINPFELHEHDLEEAWENIDEIIEGDLEAIRESEAVLLRRIDKYNLSGASIEAREAYVHDIPVIIWNDADTRVPLFLAGHSEAIYESLEDAIEAVAKAAGIALTG